MHSKHSVFPVFLLHIKPELCNTRSKYILFMSIFMSTMNIFQDANFFQIFNVVALQNTLVCQCSGIVNLPWSS